VEISERLGISVSAVEKRMKTALGSLKKIIGNRLKF
jgi:DNA-directed RNA polymerase specialized sigma24 family protein